MPDYYNEQATVEIAVSTTAVPAIEDFEKFAKRATGFYACEKTGAPAFLITNWHVVTGRKPHNAEFISPDNLRPEALLVREWVTNKVYSIALYDEHDKPRWIEIDDEAPHERGTSRIDVVAIPVRTSIHPIVAAGMFNLIYNTPEPTDPVVILGYPYSRLKCIWKTCHVAENILAHRTYFLVDGRTKPGMSGSGVFSTTIKHPHGNVLIGVYSGRIHDGAVPTGQEKGYSQLLSELDLGVVWKVGNVERLLTKARLLGIV